MDFGIDIWNFVESLAVSFVAISLFPSIIIPEEAIMSGGDVEPTRGASSETLDFRNVGGRVFRRRQVARPNDG